MFQLKRDPEEKEGITPVPEPPRSSPVSVITSPTTVIKIEPQCDMV